MRYLPRLAMALAASLLSVPGAFCQWQLQAVGGAGASRLTTDLSAVTSRGEFQVVDRRLSWTIGARASHSITDQLAFSSGLIWSAFYGHNEHWVLGNLAQERDYALHYLYVPLLIHFQWHRARLGAGSQSGIPVLGRITYTDRNAWMGYGMPDHQSSTNNVDLLRMDIGLVAEAGYGITKKLEAGIRYYRGMRDVRDHSDGIMAPLYTEQFALVLSYCFLPKAKPAKMEHQAPVPAEAEPQ